MQMPRTVVGFLLALIVVGCASYEPAKTSVPAVGVGAAQVSEEGITLTAEPCTDPNLQLALFDADLKEAGIVAINVLVRNETDHPVAARRNDMNLVLPDGRQLRPVSAQSAAVRVGEGGSPTAMMLAFGILGSIAADNAEETAQMARVTDYRLKQFEGSEIAANASSQGYVFFAPPYLDNEVGVVHLEASVMSIGDSDAIILSVPIDSTALAIKGSYEAVPTHTIR